MSAAIDASALLALLFAEPGAEIVADTIAEGAAISAVNLSEVATVLVRHKRNPEQILDPVREQLAVEPFTDADALAELRCIRRRPVKACRSVTDRASRSRSVSLRQPSRPSMSGRSSISTSRFSSSGHGHPDPLSRVPRALRDWWHPERDARGASRAGALANDHTLLGVTHRALLLHASSGHVSAPTGPREER